MFRPQLFAEACLGISKKMRTTIIKELDTLWHIYTKITIQKCECSVASSARGSVIKKRFRRWSSKTVLFWECISLKLSIPEHMKKKTALSFVKNSPHPVNISIKIKNVDVPHCLIPYETTHMCALKSMGYRHLATSSSWYFVLLVVTAVMSCRLIIVVIRSSGQHGSKASQWAPFSHMPYRCFS